MEWLSYVNENNKLQNKSIFYFIKIKCIKNQKIMPINI